MPPFLTLHQKRMMQQQAAAITPPSAPSVKGPALPRGNSNEVFPSAGSGGPEMGDPASLQGPLAKKSMLQVAQERMLKEGGTLSTLPHALSSDTNASEGQSEVPSRPPTGWVHPAHLLGVSLLAFDGLRRQQSIHVNTVGFLSSAAFPRPILQLNDARFPSFFVKHLGTRFGITKLLPLQQHVMPCILRGETTLCIGPNESGRRVAVLAPMSALIAQHMAAKGKPAIGNERQTRHRFHHGPPREGQTTSFSAEEAAASVVALCLCSSKEVEYEVRDLLRGLTFGWNVLASVHVGGSIFDGAPVVVTTPQSLMRELEENHYRADHGTTEQPLFKNLRWLYLDHCDAFLSAPLAEQAAVWWRLLPLKSSGDCGEGDGEEACAEMDQASPDTASPSAPLQTTLVGSSVTPLKAFCREYLAHGVRIVIQDDLSAWHNIAHIVEHVEEADRLLHLLNVIQRSPPPVAVVTARGPEAGEVTKYLQQMGVDVVGRVGDFRHGKGEVLVATEWALVGSHLPAFRHIINYSLPRVDIVESLNRRARLFTLEARQYVSLTTTFFNRRHPESCGAELRQLLMDTNQLVPEFLADCRTAKSDVRR